MENIKNAERSYWDQMILYCNPPVSRYQLDEFHKRCLEKQIEEYELEKYRVAVSDCLKQKFYEILKKCCINAVKRICYEENQFDAMFERYQDVFPHYYEDKDWETRNNKFNKTNIENEIKSIAGEKAFCMIVAEYEKRLKIVIDSYLPVRGSTINLKAAELSREMEDKMRLIDDDVERTSALRQEIKNIKERYVENNDQRNTELLTKGGYAAAGAFIAGAIAASRRNKSDNSGSGWSTAFSMLAGGAMALYANSQLNQQNNHHS